jgi:hypothetical protein
MLLEYPAEMFAQILTISLAALVVIPISIADLAWHKIPNIYLKVIALFTGLIIFLFGLGPVHNLLLWSVILCALLIARCGMGDIKLIALLALTCNPIFPHHQIDFWLSFGLAVLLHFVVDSLFNRRISKEIALAPSIFFALLTYLAAS